MGRFILFWMLIHVYSFSLAQGDQSETLEYKFRNAKGPEQLGSLNEWIKELSKKDAYKADSIITDFFDKNEPDRNDIRWVRLYHRMAEVKYTIRDYEASQPYLDIASKGYKLAGSPDELGRINWLQGLIFQRYQQYDSTEYFYKKALSYMDNGGSKEILAELHDRLGANYWYKRDYALSLAAYKRSIELKKQLPDTMLLRTTYRNIGLTYKTIGDFSLALEYYRKSHKMYEALGDKAGLKGLLNSIGVLYERVGDFDRSVESHLESMALSKQLYDTLAWSNSLDNIGSLNISRGDYGQALKVLLESLELLKKLTVKGRIQATLLNIGICYEKLQQPWEAKNYFRKSLEAAEAVGDKIGIGQVYSGLSSLTLAQGQYQESLSFALKEVEIASEIGTAERLRSAHSSLWNAYKALGRFDKALEHHERYVQFNSQILNAENSRSINDLKVKYEFDKREIALKQSKAEIALLDRERELLVSRQNVLTLIISMLVALVVLILFLNKRRQKSAETEKALLVEKAKNVDLVREKLNQEIQLKDLRLERYIDQLDEKNNLITSFVNKKSADLTANSVSPSKELEKIGTRIDGRAIQGVTWEDFRLKFDTVHRDYIANLIRQYPELGNHELDLCILLKINLPNKDIANILGISYDSVKKAIQRLYRKMNFDTPDDLRQYILKI